MKQIFRIFTLIAVAMLTAGQAWADGTIAIGTTEGGSLTCYSDAACTSNTKIASAAAGTTVYVMAVADGIHTLVGMTASNISVEETSGSGAAEARSVTRAPGIGLAVAVSAVEGKLGLYSFTMPSDGWNVCVKATFPDKAKTTATLAYQDWNGTALASAEKTAGQVYILDGTESILGTPGTSATNMTDVWYVCQTSATANSGAGLAYGDRYADNAVLTCADYCRVHLILKDGSKMTVESTHRGICDNNEHGAALSIYAQSDGTDMGVLTVSGTAAIETTSSLTINGGKVTATGTNGQGLRVNYGDIAIHGGEVTGIGTRSIFAYDGDVTITGGIVSADQGIMSTEQSGNGGHMTISGGEVTANSGNLWGSVSVTITGGTVIADEITGGDIGGITLGWTNTDDYIKANTYYGTVKTANSNSETHENSFMVNNVDETDLNNPIETTIAAIAGNTTLTAGQRDQLNDLAGYKVFTPASDGLTYLDWDHSDPTDATSPMALVTKNITTDGIDANNYISVLSGYHNDNLMELGADNEESWFIVIDSNKEPDTDGHSIDAAYVGMLNILGNVHLILADGAEMTVTSEDNAGINCYSDGTNTTSLAIHGQGSTTKGALTTTGNLYGIKGHDGVTIYGATVTATGVNYGIGISSETTVDIHGSIVTATGEGNSIDAQNGITISGSKVTAMSDYAGISSYNGDITLGWTNDDDFILANSYYSVNGTVKTATGQRFVAYVADWTDWRNPTVTDDAAAIVSGTKGTDFNNNAINGKCLRPLDSYCVATANSHVIFNGKTDTDGKIKPDFSIGGTHYYTYNENEAVTLSGGEDGVKVDVSGLPSGTTYDADNSTFTMPGKDVTLTLSRYMANVDYMDWDATGAQLVKKNTGSDNNTANNKVYILDGYEKTIGQDKKETWYVCNTPASSNSGKGLEYSSATISDFAGILLEGNVHFILANGSKMSVNMEDNAMNCGQVFYGSGGDFTIHGQGGQSEGTFDITVTNSADNVKGIYILDYDMNICGGNINIVAHATGDGHDAEGIVVGNGNLNIYGGNIYVHSWSDDYDGSRGLQASYDGNSTHIGSGNVNILGGTVNVITSDKGYFTNSSTFAIYAEVGNVTISNATVTTNGLYTYEDGVQTFIVTSKPPRYGIYAESGIVDGCGKVIITGDANIDAVGGTGIRAEKLVQINSGFVSATRISSGGDIEINGGQVDSHTTVFDTEMINSYETIDPDNAVEGLHYPGDAIHADGSIILGWTTATDYVRAYRISTGPAVGEELAVVKTADGKRFVAYHVDDSDPDNPVETPAAYLAGNTSLTDAELANINDPVCYKVFRPLAATVLTVPDNVSVVGKTADFSITTGEDEQAVTTHYYLYNATAQSPVTVTASYDGTDFIKLGGLSEGTTLNAVANQPMQRSFTMTAEDVALTTTAVTSFSVSGYYTYSGSAQTPSIKYGDNVIMNADDDFIVTGITKGGTTVTDAIDAGDYSLTIAGVGSYMGTASGIAFSINKKPVYNNSSTLIVDDAIYNGGIVVPEIELKDDNNNVIASSEYTVNIVPYDLFNQGIDYGNSSSIGSVMDVGIYYAVLYGKEESNYDVGVSSAFTVRQKPVGIRWSTDALVYDGTAKAPTASATGVEDVDAGKVSVTVSVDGEHSDAGNYTATASALSGNRASNYRLPTSSETGYATLTNAFAISPKPVTVISTGVTADNKIYDGTTSATLSGSFAFDDGMIIDGDDVTITGGTGAFADKNVGTGKTVVISGVTLGGTDAGNYTLSAQPTGITGSITKKTVTVSGITASNKTYDGKTTATLNYNNAAISGKVTGDKLSVSATGAFADKNAGNNKTVNISNITLTGSDKGNYTLATTGATTMANISKKALTVTADDKSVSYGDAAPTYTASYSGFVSGESKSNLGGSLGFSCSYTSSSTTGTYTITPSGLSSSNYSISYAAGTLTVGAKNVAYSGGSVTKDENGYTVTLDEGTGSANPLPDDADLYKLTYSRTLTAPGSGEGDVTVGGQAANLYTVCLPFSPVTGTGVKYYTLSGVNGETVSFEEVTTPAANTPYLVAVTGSTNITESCTGEEVTSTEINTTTKDGYTFAGTFIGLKHAQAVGKHILQSHNKWCVVESSGSVFIPPFRAYIESTSGARMLTGSLDDEATGIDSLRLLDADGSEQWYDLNGRRISKPTRKGLYIHNGKVTTTK